MRLAEFISRDMEAILREWDAFAATLYPATAKMTARGLRDHAQQILEAVVADLGTWQTTDQQSEKSMGRGPKVPNAARTAAQTHAVLRAGSGLDINQLAAEYRALRASVLRLWEEACDPAVDCLQEMVRFNEAIDQSLTESIRFFSEQVDRSRNLLLGMLGHDMRNPLNAIVMTAASLRRMNVGENVSEAAECLIRSGASIQSLLDDLVDFNRTSLGLGIRIEVGDADLAVLLADELQQLRAAHPDRRLELHVEGDVRGQWDGGRLRQVLRNLVSNASAYGAPDKPVEVTLRGDEAGVRLDVTNRGPAIEASVQEQLFDPLTRGDEDSRESNKDGLGLGLYIVREITRAHGGEVALRSDAEGTVFSVRLPRNSGS
jgi:signal transduction histidine kinase